MYKKVELKDGFVGMEREVAENWKKKDIIKKNFPSFLNIKKLGVQSISTHMCCINGQNFEIGKTEILEFNEVNITSIYFKQDEPATTLVDCILG